MGMDFYYCWPLQWLKARPCGIRWKGHYCSLCIWLMNNDGEKKPEILGQTSQLSSLYVIMESSSEKGSWGCHADQVETIQPVTFLINVCITWLLKTWNKKPPLSLPLCSFAYGDLNFWLNLSRGEPLLFSGCFSTLTTCFEILNMSFSVLAALLTLHSYKY